MKFSDFELSLFKARPIELYRFTLGQKEWMYTSASRDITFRGDRYESVYLKRSTIRQTADSNIINDMEITIDQTTEVVQLFKANIPNQELLVNITETHDGLMDGEAQIKWMGRVRGVAWEGATAKIKADAMTSIINRCGLRMNYQTGCNHMLYSPMCGVRGRRHRSRITIESVQGNQVSVQGLEDYDGHYNLGYIVSNSINYMILSQSGNVLTLLSKVEGLELGASVFVYEGCDRSLSMCWSKFGNGLNYGGFPYTPALNPFDVGIL